MMGMPRVKTVRGISDYGYSWIYVIFEDGTDPYWAEHAPRNISRAQLQNLPQGVKTELGPDANGLGWIFQYVLTDPTGKHDPGQLRAVQDWYMRYHLRPFRRRGSSAHTSPVQPAIHRDCVCRSDRSGHIDKSNPHPFTWDRVRCYAGTAGSAVRPRDISACGVAPCADRFPSSKITYTHE